MTHYVRDKAVNPNDPKQRYAMWTNGRIDAYGGAPPIQGPNWYDRVDPVAMALHITNWTKGQGYILDWQGGFTPLNGAPDLMSDAVQYPLPSVPGVEYVTYRKYIDWSWDPNGSGQGYVLDEWGQLFPFGGATAPPRTGPRWSTPAGIRLEMQWGTTKKAVTLDIHGGVHGDFGAPTTYTGRPYWPGKNYARDIAITNWSTAAGYVLDLYGTLHPFNGAPYGFGSPWQEADVSSTVHVLSGSNPVRIWQVWQNGQPYEYVFSDPPMVVAGGLSGSPASTVSTTTRPELTWSYVDPQRDEQIAWQVLVFTQTFVDGHDMTNPLQWIGNAIVAQEGNQRAARGIVCPVDLSNGTKRMYVRAMDSAKQWSAWSNRGWNQAVTAPATPTSLTAVADNTTLTTRLSAVTPAGNNATLVRFEFSDDQGASWFPVTGGDALLRTDVTTHIDRMPPMGKRRRYRVCSYSNQPRVSSAYSNSAEATITRLVHTLTSVGDPTLGGEIRVQEPHEWTRPVKAGVFQGIGAKFATVVSDGIPKSRRGTLNLLSLDRATWQMITRLAESDSTLVYRDPFGEVIYCRLTSDWTQKQLKAAATGDEITPLRHSHTTQLPLTEVAPPGRPS